jgi:ATP-dependent RNA helicase DHX29
MQRDPLLKEISHVVLDEVHERSVQGDFLATLLRDLIVRRRKHAASLGLPPLKARPSPN